QVRLTEEQPNLSLVQDDLARTHFNLSDLQRKANKNHLALESYDEAARIWRRLTQLQPTVLDNHTRLGDTLALEARIWSADGKTVQAIQASKEALEVQRRIAATNPGAARNRGDLARRQFQLGNVLRIAKQSAEADSEYQDALRIQQQLVSELSNVPNYQVD